MAIMDPLINTGFLWRCLAAYAGIKSDTKPPHDELASVEIVTDTNGGPAKDSSDPEAEAKMHEDTYYTRLRRWLLRVESCAQPIPLGDIMGTRQAFLLRKLRESSLPDHPYMSPLRASDDILRQFPTTYLIVSAACECITSACALSIL